MYNCIHFLYLLTGILNHTIFLQLLYKYWYKMEFYFLSILKLPNKIIIRIQNQVKS